ncbi:MAG: hypothetical protein RL326_713 [Pseudomonadota bacterium]
MPRACVNSYISRGWRLATTQEKKRISHEHMATALEGNAPADNLSISRVREAGNGDSAPIVQRQPRVCGRMHLAQL